MPSAVVFAISDLHLGGRSHENIGCASQTGSQICASYERLTHFIDWLASGEAAAHQPVELVINGDIVDFLLLDDEGCGALNGFWTPDQDEIIRRLDSIVKRTREGRERGPFDALRDYCAIGRHGGLSLTLILGNHDIELSLPKVRSYLLNDILQSNGAAVRFIVDGEAYTRGDLLIEHGNRYDYINAVDHDLLRRERSAISRCEKTPQPGGHFRPPAGSILVTELFNPLKERYRFLDLLKPETGAVLPLMMALEPSASGIIEAAMKCAETRWRLPSAARRTQSGQGNRGYISPGESPPLLDLRGMLRAVLGADADKFSIPISGGISVSDAWQTIKDIQAGMASWGRGLLASSRTAIIRSRLMAVMRRLGTDTSFDLHVEREPYLAEAKVLASHFSTVVFGHTHLPKDVEIAIGDRAPSRYLNTGTWANTMQVPQEVIGGDCQALDSFLDDLEQNRLDSYLRVNLTYARIELAGSAGQERVASSGIRSYRGKMNPDCDPLPEPLGDLS